MSNIPAILKQQYDFTDNEFLKAFTGVELRPFSQDTEDWTDPVTEEFFPATFDYFANLLGVRKKDSVPFCVVVRMHHKMIDREDGPIREAYIKTTFVNAVLTLETFSECTCTPEKPCQRHPR